MKKYHILLTLVLAVFVILGSCKKDFLNVKPTGSLDQGLLSTTDGIDALLVGAYSMLDGISSQFGWEAASSNWVYGSIRGLEANKGTDSGDQPDINPLQTFSEVATNPYLNVKWRAVYESISRCNSAIMVINKAVADGKLDQAKADVYLQQAKALRGWYHFEAWRMWTSTKASIPYMDEKTDPATVVNTEDVTAKIIADMTEGTKLPTNMGAIGKFNKTVCQVLLAKAMMQMKKDYTGALALLNSAKGGTKPDGSAIGLAPTYGEVFDIANRNGIESIYTVQYSVNDGSGAYNAGWGEVLNFPYKSGGSPGGCCGFFNPTQEFVNSFRTVGGLPLLDFSYNSAANQILRDQAITGGSEWDATKTYDKNQGCTAYAATAKFTDLGYVSLVAGNKGNNPLTSPASWQLKWTEDNTKAVDPRLDWSVGRRGIPYWDWGVHTGSDWIRDQTYSGPYSPKKQVYKKSQEGKYTEVGNWTSGWTANGYRMIRYADLLLLIAECQIETNDLAGALININLIRNRAANTAGFVVESDGTTPAATYQISPYASLGSQANARLVLQMERKLELGQEGHRWFDLNRWGNTVTELNRALTYEKTMPWGSALYGSATVGAEDVTFPVPQRQLDLSNGKLVQNR
jgi:hypothetical protein